ncbi:MAG: serine/threonine protein kinase [Gammaproteobacteria bacterium]|nr:serine/threonine protein kinase [Gammaproteobacteria bacterium]
MPPAPTGTSNARELLKSDLLGTVCRIEAGGQLQVERDTQGARWWLRWLARWLCRREARALARLDGLPGTPRLINAGRDHLQREWLDGRPMQLAQPRDPAWYRAALALLVALHRRGVAHNDLAKEPNWLVTPDGRPALVDFQLASVTRRRGRWFRMLAREDLRHLLKHKRSYCPQRLTARQRHLLLRPAPASRLWMATGKPLYRFVTRRLLGWADREGAGDRHH